MSNTTTTALQIPYFHRNLLRDCSDSCIPLSLSSTGPDTRYRHDTRHLQTHKSASHHSNTNPFPRQQLRRQSRQPEEEENVYNYLRDSHQTSHQTGSSSSSRINTKQKNTDNASRRHAKKRMWYHHRLRLLPSSFILHPPFPPGSSSIINTNQPNPTQKPLQPFSMLHQ